MNTAKPMADLLVEPDNRQLRQRMELINQLRAQHLPTVPSTIEQELATNPLFREDSLALQKTVNKVNGKPVDVFAEIRRLKDRF